jgi:preprotein translocase subunit SecE
MANKVREWISGVRLFFEEVGGEMKKTAWPHRQELFESTVVVIISVVLLSAFVGISDRILVLLLKLAVPFG